MRAIFMGTPEIAVASLEALTQIAEVVAVVCQPDRPAGRGLQLQPPAVKVFAERAGLSVHQPTKVRTPEFAQWMRELETDVALVLAYGRILPPAVLSAPRRGCLNLHASLLPRYRGAAPLNWCIARGETETGVSLMQMDEGLDTGPVYATRRIGVGPDETAGELAVRMARLAAEMVRNDVVPAVNGELHAVPQDHALATLAPPLAKGDGRIDWNRTPAEVHAHVRGMSPWPSAFTHVGDKVLKVLGTRRSSFQAKDERPGTIVVADPHATLVACRGGTLEITRAQLPGRQALSAHDLVVGRAFAAGQTFT